MVSGPYYKFQKVRHPSLSATRNTAKDVQEYHYHCLYSGNFRGHHQSKLFFWGGGGREGNTYTAEPVSTKEESHKEVNAIEAKITELPEYTQANVKRYLHEWEKLTTHDNYSPNYLR